MAIKDLNNSKQVNERSSLINNSQNDTSGSIRQESIHRRSSAYLNDATKKQRFRAIRICYFGIFVSSIVFSITVSSLWPFLQTVDATAEATFLGWVVASFSIGQLIASPALGYIANRTNNNKMPLVISTAFIVISNILYAYVQSFNNVGISNKWWIMLARFIMGIGAANSAVMRSYGSSATTLTERTGVMAILSACQGVGFILGPVIQALFAFLGKPPGPVEYPWLHFNMYTSPAFFSALMGGINLVLFLVAFKDVRIVTSSRKSINGSSSNQLVSPTTYHDQLMAIICCLYMFFVAYLTFTNYETIASPLSIDMYAWTKEQSTRNNGFILGGLGCMSVVVLIVTKRLTKRFEDRTLMLAGMIISFLGYFIFLPWGNDYPPSQIASFTPTPVTDSVPSTSSPSLPTTTADPDGTGCPLDYPWCYYVPRVQLWQYITASVVITIGFSICNVISYSLFSKKLGHRPQGTMMGLFNSAGAFARAVGPITVGFLYKNWGPRIMMIVMLVFVLTSILSLIFNYKRLYIEPEEVDDSDHEEENDVNINEHNQLNINNDLAE